MVINRYSRPEMAAIWSDENKYKAWLEVEILRMKLGLNSEKFQQKM